MKIFKKISGIILLLFSVLLFLGTIISTFNTYRAPDNEWGASSSERVGYGLGIIIGCCILLAIVYFLFKFSLKLVENKPLKKTSEIEEIGK